MGVFLLRVQYGFELSRNAKVGKKVVFNHRGMGTVIAPDSIIGDGTWIEHHVTLGIRHSGDKILIGKNCYIGAYACILENITIGDNCKIGAGTLVLEDIPAESVVVNPRKLKYIEEYVCQILKNVPPSKCEILIINDGSTDNSSEKCASLERMEPDVIKFINCENQGVSLTRNLGIEQAKGEYIDFVDQDNFVENFMNVYEDMADIIIFNWERCDSRVIQKKELSFETEEFFPNKREKLIENLLYPLEGSLANAALVFPWGKFYKRSFLLDNSIRFNPEVKICEDVYFNIMCFMAYDTKVTYIRNTGYYYYENKYSAGSSYNKNACEIGIKSNQLITDLVKKIDTPQIRTANYYSILYRFWWCISVDFYHIENKDSIMQRARRLKELRLENSYSEAFEHLDESMLSIIPKNQRLLMKIICNKHYVTASLLCKLRIFNKRYRYSKC